MKRRREILRGAALKAAVAEREAARAEIEAARIAAEIEAGVRRAALRPKQGWWRGSPRRRFKVLRFDAVMSALSVGCTAAQIARAAGTTARHVGETRSTAVANPDRVYRDDEFDRAARKRAR